MGIPSGRPAGTMATATYRVFDPLLPRAQAERMLRLCERFGAYGMYSQEASEAEIGQGRKLRHPGASVRAAVLVQRALRHAHDRALQPGQEPLGLTRPKMGAHSLRDDA